VSGGIWVVVHWVGEPMAYTADFQIIVNSGLSGVTLIEPMNEEAQNYLTEEANMHVMDSGYATIRENDVPTFVDSAAQAHLYAAAI